MRIVWLDLNSSYAHSSLALPALHAQLTTCNNIQWEIVSATINENVGMVVNDICRLQPDILAATCWLFNHEVLMHICSRLKALLPNVCIALGGPEFLGDNISFLQRNTFIDVVFRGEGEESFAYWLKQWDKPENWETIQGICYINKQGKFHDNGIAKVKNFISLQAPESSIFFNWDKPFVQLETTRGCFNTCSFCVSGGEKPIRSIDIEKIRQRLSTIHQHGIRNVRVLDRTFNYNTRHALALLSLFEEFPTICFHLEIHPTLLSEPIKEKLKTLPKGLLHLEAGIQSLHQQVLDACRRMGKLEDALNGLQFLCTLPNMETHADLIAGLPHYKLTDIFEDIQTLASFDAREIQLESLKLLPGTEMRRRASEWGICYAPLPPYEVLQSNDITPYELQEARHLSRLLDAYYNTKAWHHITRELILFDKQFTHRFLKHLQENNLIDQPTSLEKRGIVLYQFCKSHYPTFNTPMSIAWIEAGLSLKKEPAEKVRTKHITPPTKWNIEYGEYKENLRLCFLPLEDNTGYWFGFESEAQCPIPIFKAENISFHQSK